MLPILGISPHVLDLIKRLMSRQEDVGIPGGSSAGGLVDPMQTPDRYKPVNYGKPVDPNEIEREKKEAEMRENIAMLGAAIGKMFQRDISILPGSPGIQASPFRLPWGR